MAVIVVVMEDLVREFRSVLTAGGYDVDLAYEVYTSRRELLLRVVVRHVAPFFRRNFVALCRAPKLCRLLQPAVVQLGEWYPGTRIAPDYLATTYSDLVRRGHTLLNVEISHVVSM